MGTDIYGSYDHLVIDLHGLDAVRAGRRTVRLDLDDVISVTVEDPGDVDRAGDDRTEHLGACRHPAVVVTADDGRGRRRHLALHHPDAVAIAADLVRCGVGRQLATVTT